MSIMTRHIAIGINRLQTTAMNPTTTAHKLGHVNTLSFVKYPFHRRKSPQV